jgi:hypothetical protein
MHCVRVAAECAARCEKPQSGGSIQCLTLCERWQWRRCKGICVRWLSPSRYEVRPYNCPQHSSYLRNKWGNFAIFAAIRRTSSPPLRIAQLLIWVQTFRVEYRGIRYTIRARIEREQWSVAIHPTGVEMKGKVVIGSREKAELQARAMINRWLRKHSTQNPKSN